MNRTKKRNKQFYVCLSIYLSSIYPSSLYHLPIHLLLTGALGVSLVLEQLRLAKDLGSSTLRFSQVFQLNFHLIFSPQTLFSDIVSHAAKSILFPPLQPWKLKNSLGKNVIAVLCSSFRSFQESTFLVLYIGILMVTLSILLS